MFNAKRVEHSRNSLEVAQAILPWNPFTDSSKLLPEEKSTIRQDSNSLPPLKGKEDALPFRPPERHGLFFVFGEMEILSLEVLECSHAIYNEISTS